jgi:hypothetical protein
MRAAIGPVLAHLALLGAGYGVLRLCGTLGALSARRILAYAGLAYLAGASAVGTLLIALLTIGVHLTLPLFACICVALVLPFAIALVRHSAWRGLALRDGWRGLDTEGRAAAGCVVALLLAALVGCLTVGARPVAEYDVWQSWTRKALLLFYYAEIPRDIFSAQATASIAPAYPILMPLLEALQFRAGGRPAAEQAHIVPWLLHVASIWAFCALGARIARPLVWAGVAGGVGIALIPNVVTGLADAPAAGMIGVGVLALGLWLHEGQRSDLALAAVVLAGAAGMKLEATVLAALAFAVAFALSIPNGRRCAGSVALAGAVSIAAALGPWRIWIANSDAPPSVGIGSSLSPDFLIDRADRIWPSLEAIVIQFTRFPVALVTVPIALALAIVAVRELPRLVAFYLSLGILYIVFLVWVYMASAFDLGVIVFTTVERVYLGVVMVALAAVLHLSASATVTARRELEAPPGAAPG